MTPRRDKFGWLPAMIALACLLVVLGGGLTLLATAALDAVGALLSPE